MYFNQKRGFTLIELLVVISIIALLTIGLLAAMDQARAKGRDAERISDVKQIQVALELYYAKNKVFPNDLGVLEPDHINAVPKDPKTDDPYRYEALDSNKNYRIQTTSEVDDTKICELKSLGAASFPDSTSNCPFK